MNTRDIWDLERCPLLRGFFLILHTASTLYISWLSSLGGVVWRVKCSDVKLVCAVGSRNGIEDTKLIVLDFDDY